MLKWIKFQEAPSDKLNKKTIMKTLTNIFLTILTMVLLQSCIVSEKPNMEFFSNSAYDFKGAKFTSINVPMVLAKSYIKKLYGKKVKVKRRSTW